MALHWPVFCRRPTESCHADSSAAHFFIAHPLLYLMTE